MGDETESDHDQCRGCKHWLPNPGWAWGTCNGTGERHKAAAALETRWDFGCVMHEQREHENRSGGLLPRAPNALPMVLGPPAAVPLSPSRAYADLLASHERLLVSYEASKQTNRRRASMILSAVQCLGQKQYAAALQVLVHGPEGTTGDVVQRLKDLALAYRQMERGGSAVDLTNAARLLVQAIEEL